MKIAVLGSWKWNKNQEIAGLQVDLPKLKDKENFSPACTELGKQMSLSGHSLLVTSDGSNTADYWVVDGFI